jgi:hypothetical protein
MAKIIAIQGIAGSEKMTLTQALGEVLSYEMVGRGWTKTECKK